MRVKPHYSKAFVLFCPHVVTCPPSPTDIRPILFSCFICIFCIANSRFFCLQLQHQPSRQPRRFVTRSQPRGPISAICICAGAPCFAAWFAHLFLSHFPQFSQEHEAECAVSLIQPSLFGTAISINRARPRPSPQCVLAARVLEFDVEGSMIDGSGDEMWES
jgi:hypothetical protein